MPIENHDRLLNRRQLLGVAGSVAGTAMLSSNSQAESSSQTPPQIVRVVTVSYSPPFHDHRSQGIDLAPLREMTAKVAREKPDFICFPEACACIGAGFIKGIETAPELSPYVETVGKIAREFNTALVVPFIEREGGKFYNSVPIVDRRGNFVLNYRKNYPTISEMEAGISPGTEVPVAECDGVRVGAAVCFDANFDFIAAKLAEQRARLVFWPSMYWGGRLLQHWCQRYGFAMGVAYGAESAVIDMNGNYLSRQGQETLQVRNQHLPPWAMGDINVNRELYHLDYNQKKLAAIVEKYTPDIEIEVQEPEGFFLMASRRPDLRVESIAADFQLETLQEYLVRSMRMRDGLLKG